MLYSDVSDHMPVLLMIDNLKRPKARSEIYIRDTRKFVVEDFLNGLSIICYEILRMTDENPTPSINSLFEKFVSQFEIMLNSHAPTRRLSRKERKLTQKPQLTKNVLKTIKLKNKLYKKMMTNPSAINATQYKQCRNKLNHTLDRSKKQYYKNLIDTSSHNSGLVCKTINDIIKYKSKSTAIPTKHILPY